MDQSALGLLKAVAPFLICALAGALLAIFELVQTFRGWLGKHFFHREVAAIISLNIATALIVYSIIHFVIGVESTLWLAVATGVTFPAILRSNFTFYRPANSAGGAADLGAVSLRVGTWYENLQTLGVEAVNRTVADGRAQSLRELRETFSEQEIIDRLEDHITAELVEGSRQDHEQKLAAIRALTDASKRLRYLAGLALDILPESRIQEFLRK